MIWFQAQNNTFESEKICFRYLKTMWNIFVSVLYNEVKYLQHLWRDHRFWLLFFSLYSHSFTIVYLKSCHCHVKYTGMSPLCAVLHSSRNSVLYQAYFDHVFGTLFAGFTWQPYPVLTFVTRSWTCTPRPSPNWSWFCCHFGLPR